MGTYHIVSESSKNDYYQQFCYGPQAGLVWFRNTKAFETLYNEKKIIVSARKRARTEPQVLSQEMEIQWFLLQSGICVLVRENHVIMMMMMIIIMLT